MLRVDYRTILDNSTGGSGVFGCCHYQVVTVMLESSASAFTVAWLGAVARDQTWAPMRFENLCDGTSASQTSASGLYSAPVDALDAVCASLSGVGGGNVSVTAAARSY